MTEVVKGCASLKGKDEQNFKKGLYQMWGNFPMTRIEAKMQKHISFNTMTVMAKA
jgi:hypothetical protein